MEITVEIEDEPGPAFSMSSYSFASSCDRPAQRIGQVAASSSRAVRYSDTSNNFSINRFTGEITLNNVGLTPGNYDFSVTAADASGQVDQAQVRVSCLPPATTTSSTTLGAIENSAPVCFPSVLR